MPSVRLLCSYRLRLQSTPNLLINRPRSQHVIHRFGRRAYSEAPTQPVSTVGQQTLSSSASNAPAGKFPTPTLRRRRILRPTLYATVFFLAGFVSMQIAVTLPYLTPTNHPPNSPLDLQLVEKSNHKIDSSTLVQELKSQGWVEDTSSSFTISSSTGENVDVRKGKHLVRETLPRPGIRGLTTRVFRSTTSKVSLIVVHIGPGCESWPQFAHGGVTTTLLIEAVENHFAYFYPDRVVPTEKDVTVKFKAPVRTFGVYAILVSPVMEQKENGKSFVNLEAQFDRLPTPPKIIERPDPDSVTTHITEIRKSKAQTLAAVQVRMPATHRA